MSTKPLPPPTPSQWAMEIIEHLFSDEVISGLSFKFTTEHEVKFQIAMALDAAKAQGAKEEREAISVMLEGNADALDLLPEEMFAGKYSSLCATRNLATSVRARGAAGKSS